MTSRDSEEVEREVQARLEGMMSALSHGLFCRNRKRATYGCCPERTPSLAAAVRETLEVLGQWGYLDLTRIEGGGG